MEKRMRQGAKSVVWLFQMSDKQRRIMRFSILPYGSLLKSQISSLCRLLIPPLCAVQHASILGFSTATQTLTIVEMGSNKP
jgi:hypothetical protein